MKITIAAVGRLRSGATKQLFEEYTRRLRWTVTLQEVDNGRGPSAAARRRDEGKRLSRLLPKGVPVVALDETGDDLDSVAFSARLERWRDDGIRELTFVIGGADGLDETIRKDAAVVLAFGKQTWPHFLIRVMLAEQLYRAYTISTRHPYHRK
tara:strand:+ start:213 stop:671 length:459 start_codon:yes stop_codon:yes gene_type:complete